MQKLKVEDNVVVIAGKDKGKTGKIKSINFKTNKVHVDGVNIVKKAVRPTQENPNGGILEVERAIHISNVALVSPKTNKATRVKVDKKDGKNVRVAVACKSVLS